MMLYVAQNDIRRTIAPLPGVMVDRQLRDLMYYWGTSMGRTLSRIPFIKNCKGKSPDNWPTKIAKESQQNITRFERVRPFC